MEIRLSQKEVILTIAKSAAFFEKIEENVNEYKDKIMCMNLSNGELFLSDTYPNENKIIVIMAIAQYFLSNEMHPQSFFSYVEERLSAIRFGAVRSFNALSEFIDYFNSKKK